MGAAGSDSISVQRATVVSWILLGVYHTRQKLHTMKKVDSPHCILCSNPVEGVVEDRNHLTLLCPIFSEIRGVYFKKIEEINPNISDVRGNQSQFLISILDPFSPKVPEKVREGWPNSDIPYEISRNYFSAIHKKRKKLIENIEKNVQTEQSGETDEPVTKLIFRIYSEQENL